MAQCAAASHLEITRSQVLEPVHHIGRFFDEAGRLCRQVDPGQSVQECLWGQEFLGPERALGGRSRARSMRILGVTWVPRLTK